MNGQISSVIFVADLYTRMLIRLSIIILLTLLLYRRSINYGYIIDDMEVATHKRTGRFWRDLWYQIRGHAYFNHKTEHSITLFFHILNSCLIYLAFGQTNVAFLAALLFCINPVNNQGSVW